MEDFIEQNKIEEVKEIKEYKGNKFEKFSFNILGTIVKYLDIASYLSLGSTNSKFWKILRSDYFLTIYLNNLEVFKIAEDLKKNQNFQFDFDFLKTYGKIFNLGFKKRNDQQLLFEGIYNSSQDFDQNIQNTLSNNNVFWSSSGTQNSRDRNEYLIYRLEKPSLISEIIVEFYLAEYLQQKQYFSEEINVYLSLNQTQWIHIKNYFVPQHGNQNGQILYSQQNPPRLTISLDKICLAKFLKLEFIGKTGVQEIDQLRYVAVRYVSLRGQNIQETENQKQNQLIQVLLKTQQQGQENLDLDDSIREIQIFQEFQKNILPLFYEFEKNKANIVEFYNQKFPESYSNQFILKEICSDKQLWNFYYNGLVKQGREQLNSEESFFWYYFKENKYAVFLEQISLFVEQNKDQIKPKEQQQPTYQIRNNFCFKISNIQNIQDAEFKYFIISKKTFELIIEYFIFQNKFFSLEFKDKIEKDIYLDKQLKKVIKSIKVNDIFHNNIQIQLIGRALNNCIYMFIEQTLDN